MFLVFTLLAAAAAAPLVYVDVAGVCNSATPCFADLASAVAAVDSPGTVLLMDGVHAVPAEIVFIAKTIVLESLSMNADACVLDAGGVVGSHRLFGVAVNSYITFRGLGFTGGNVKGKANPGERGAVIYAQTNGVAVLEGCKCFNNHAEFGGSFYTNSARVIIRNSTITDTSAQQGGAILAVGDVFEVFDSVIERATASWSGGAAMAGSSSQVKLTRTLIKSCGARFGGGVTQNGGGVTLTDSVIDDCTATSAGGGGGGYALYNSGFTLNNTVIQNCHSNAYGGGLVVAQFAEVQMLGSSQIIKCSAATKGGGILIQDRSFVDPNVEPFVNNYTPTFANGPDVLCGESGFSSPAVEFNMISGDFSKMQFTGDPGCPGPLCAPIGNLSSLVCGGRAVGSACASDSSCTSSECGATGQCEALFEAGHTCYEAAAGADCASGTCLSDHTCAQQCTNASVCAEIQCGNYISGVSGASCQRYANVLVRVCSLGNCVEGTEACDIEGVGTQSAATCGSAQCVDAVACSAHDLWLGQVVCLADSAPPTTPCPDVACGTWHSGWTADTCGGYAGDVTNGWCGAGSCVSSPSVAFCNEHAGMAATTPCADAGCVDPASCNGTSAGACFEDGQPHGCAVGVCGVGGVCSNVGEPCTSPANCTSTFCVSGTCCASACSGECDNCTTGTCVAHSNQEFDGCLPPACAGVYTGWAGNKCKMFTADPSGYCNGTGACDTTCDRAPLGVVSTCLSAACADSTTCVDDIAGVCFEDGQPHGCAVGVCGVGGVCSNVGEPCTSPANCNSTFCVSGTCCASACSGECDNCTTGTCVAHSNQEFDGCLPPACAGVYTGWAGNECKMFTADPSGYCNGTGACDTTCDRAPLGVVSTCLSAACADNTTCVDDIAGVCFDDGEPCGEQEVCSTGGACMLVKEKKKEESAASRVRLDLVAVFLALLWIAV